ncbi:MAG: transposase [Dehalococcoidia bacterium]
MSKERRSFSRELKQEAVRQVTEMGRPIGQVAREVGVRPEQLRTWKNQLVGTGEVQAVRRVETAEEELRRVKRELEVVRQERDFLKKAAAFFAKGSA